MVHYLFYPIDLEAVTEASTLILATSVLRIICKNCLSVLTLAGHDIPKNSGRIQVHKTHKMIEKRPGEIRSNNSMQVYNITKGKFEEITFRGLREFDKNQARILDNTQNFEDKLLPYVEYSLTAEKLIFSNPNYDLLVNIITNDPEFSEYSISNEDMDLQTDRPSDFSNLNRLKYDSHFAKYNREHEYNRTSQVVELPFRYKYLCSKNTMCSVSGHLVLYTLNDEKRICEFCNYQFDVNQTTLMNRAIAYSKLMEKAFQNCPSLPIASTSEEEMQSDMGIVAQPLPDCDSSSQ